LLTLTDTHCHLDFNAFDQDRESVLERALQMGVQHIVNPGCDLESSQKAVRLAHSHPECIRAAIGIHPNDGLSWKCNTIEELRQLAQQPGIVAIGEIGLDYYRNKVEPSVQQDIFRQQLHLAADLSLPVIIHNRQATADMLIILTEWIAQLKEIDSPLLNHPGVLHSFSEELVTAKKMISMNFYLGIGGPVTFQNARRLQEIVKELPLERLLLETDAPFLSPHLHRGQRNEPAHIPLIADKIAVLHQVDIAKVAEITSRNAALLFSWRI
jgi:TatD DNase family protein